MRTTGGTPTSPPTSPPTSRAARKQATRERLVEATLAAIVEVGYHRTSLGEVCTRAGSSRGGLFRHFDSREDLVVAAAEEAGRRHLDGFVAWAAASPDLTVADQVAYVRDQTRGDANAVWLELLVAARTDADLRVRLRPAAERLHRGVADVARATYGAAAADAGVDDAAVLLAITSALHLFDGEALLHAVLPRPDLETAHLDLVARLFADLLTAR